MTTTTADWARYYGHLGWRVFPVKVGAKSPIYRNWQADATTDPALIGQYWSDGEASDRNVGVVCGEAFDAWDIEAAHLSAFSAWMYDHGVTLPADCPIASTGRGGVHILTSPTGVDGTRRLFLDGTHIGELKSRGGLIVVCPSETEAAYLWVNAPVPGPLAPAAAWMLDMIRQPNAEPPTFKPWKQVSLAPKHDLAPLVREVATKAEGDRNNDLHWAANRAFDDGIPFALAERELLDAYMTAIAPHEDRFEREHEGRATIASAYRR